MMRPVSGCREVVIPPRLERGRRRFESSHPDRQFPGNLFCLIKNETLMGDGPAVYDRGLIRLYSRVRIPVPQPPRGRSAPEARRWYRFVIPPQRQQTQASGLRDGPQFEWAEAGVPKGKQEILGVASDHLVSHPGMPDWRNGKRDCLRSRKLGVRIPRRVPQDLG